MKRASAIDPSMKISKSSAFLFLVAAFLVVFSLVFSAPNLRLPAALAKAKQPAQEIGLKAKACVTLPQTTEPYLNIAFNSLQHYPHPDENVAFSKCRLDWSGAYILDMLHAHAFAYKENITHGGSCVDVNDPAIEKNKHNVLQHSALHQRVIHALGLQDVLLPIYMCSPTNQSSHTVVDIHECFKCNTGIWTPAWVKAIKSIMHYPCKGAETIKSELKHLPNNMLNVVIHMRRGGVSPCPHTTGRCLPNSHCKRVMDHFLWPQKKHANNETKGHNITIFSESKSFEDWNYFENITNVTLRLDTDIEDVWNSMMDANTLILSKSSFSVVPAAFNEGTVICTPMLLGPLKAWTKVPESISSQMAKEVELLKNTC
jgi:hypothetical protein